MELRDLGFTEWFEEHYRSALTPDVSPARIIAVNRDNYIISNEDGEVPAEITGKIMYGAESNLDFPTVGDWVSVQYFDHKSFAMIHNILPRKTLLKRKVAGKKIDYQGIAANIDFAFIMQSLDFNFNVRRLERYLIMVNEGSIQPVILLSKRDLITQELLKQHLNEIKNLHYDYDIIAFSNKTGKGLDLINNNIISQKTYCLLGSSGVGKTTLLNHLIGEEVFATDTVREKDSKGKHVTARRQLILLKNGGLIIDTPGMRELGNIEIQTGIAKTFTDIQFLSQTCRYKNCKHVNEPGCAVLEAVEKGEINVEQYQNYLRVRKESEYHEMSYLEKRKRDKKFGRMVKEVMKHKKGKV